VQKLFTVAEARELLPELRKLLAEANAELEDLADAVRLANHRYASAEEAMDEGGTPSTAEDEVESLRARRSQFQHAIEELSRTQKDYLRALNNWVDQICGKGVLLRDLHEGLLDFPASQNGFDYFLCWKANEGDISHWHPTNEGFAGRKPLVLLDEYC
jgi:hypothetical protein